MSKTHKFIAYWLPLLFWMSVIFTASSDAHSAEHSSTLFEPVIRWLFPHMAQDRIGQLHHLFRKSCHVMEYATLGWLAWRAIRQPRKNDLRPWQWDEAGLALAIVFLYAASDELHQVFVPTRTALFSDVLVDTSGGLISLTLLWLAGRKIWF